jgi:hypothetical protein
MSKLDRLRALCLSDPNNVFAFYTLAMELKKTDAKAALPIFADIRAKHPDYVPSYYQYAKTLEETGDDAQAKTIYREGMEVAKKAGDMHAFGELEAALDLLR